MKMDYNRPNSIRVAYENWLYSDRFEELLALLAKYPCGISQISLFTAIVHTPLTLEELSRRAGIIRERMARAREAGFSAGINILATVGHHNEDLQHTLGDRFRHMMNIRGEKSDGCYCMNDESFMAEHIVPAYTALADAKPDYIWVDDDVRCAHMPIGNGCFCDGCIALFNAANGADYTRETLRAALNSGDTELRRKWLRHNSESIARLFRTIGGAVRAVSPEIRLGFMTGERYMEGYDFAMYADALSDGGKHEIMWRPGGGAYTDNNFDGFIEKAQQIGRQNAYLPPYVTEIQSEIENFPYQLIKKTPKSTALEAALYMAHGCTGTAFNILPSETLEPVSMIEKHLRAIDAMSPFYALLSRALAGMKPRGIHTGWRTDSQAAVPEGEWVEKYGGMYADYARELFSFGLPECYDKALPCVTLMTGESAAVMSDSELTDLFRGGLYLDARAVKYLCGRGFASYIGFTAGDEFKADAREVYADVPMNDGIAGGIRNCRQAFNFGDSYGVVPMFGDCMVLSRLEDYHGNVLAPCVCGLYENSLGGRVCVEGYYPFSWVSDVRKTVQLNRIFLYLSRGTLPSYVSGYCRIHHMSLSDGERSVEVLFNPSNDALTDVRLCVKTDSREAVIIGEDCSETPITAEKLCGGEYSAFGIKELAPFGMALVIVK